MNQPKNSFIAILAITSILLSIAACRKANSDNRATPTAALETVRAAERNKDVQTFKRSLSSRSIGFVEAEATRTKTTVDRLLADYLERREPNEASESSGREVKIDGNTVEIRGVNERVLGRFVKEANEWKLDGFGWPMKPTS
ncbi:MAG TPA: hypothetical protein VJ843_00415 [Candidatus Saccharimonadales bacterium]|nr:hypothetical protein [Candidatus Saccharimonadales bacterium]